MISILFGTKYRLLEGKQAPIDLKYATFTVNTVSENSSINSDEVHTHYDPSVPIKWACDASPFNSGVIWSSLRSGVGLARFLS